MLEKLGPDLWVAEGQCVNFHGFPYPTRSVIVRLMNQDIWVWSPIEISEPLAGAVEELGPVKHLVSPNKIHHLFLSQWHERFPDALVWGPKTIQEKRRDLQFQPALGGTAPKAWRDEIEQFHIEGSFAMDEILFIHKKSKTLILADFSENFGKQFLEENWRGWQRWIARRWGIVAGKGYAPLDWRLSFLSRGKLRALRRDLLTRDIDRVVMAHGEIQRSDGIRFLQTSLEWI